MTPKRILSLAAATLLASACGSSSSEAPAPLPATGLSYVDPAGSGWRLVQNPSSTSTRLVLDLVGPADVSTRGVGFNLAAPQPSIKFGKFDDGLALRDTGVLELQNTQPDPAQSADPVLKAAALKSGNVLSVGLFQKDRRASAKPSSAPLLQIALELRSGHGLAAGTPIPLEIRKARIIPADIGQLGNDTEILARSHLVDVPLQVGSLTAN
jgi:hypothetical protein